MTTSGTAVFTATRAQIIEFAARKVVVLASGTNMSSAMLQQFDFQLNAMVKEWQGTGLHIWTIAEATLFPQLSQRRYALALGASDHIADTNTYVATTISADEASGQTTLSVTSSSGMTAADKIGIVVDDGTIHWTTVASVPTSTSVTINTALDDSAAAGAEVYAYTNNIVRPLKIPAARRYNVSDGREVELRPMSHLEYQAQPNKANSGLVNSFYYDAQLSTGYLYLWPTPSAVDELIRLTWHRPIEDFNAAGDNPDLPQEWINAIGWNLAMYMAPEYTVPMERFNQIVALAGSTLDTVKGFDREETSIYFQPDLGD